MLAATHGHAKNFSIALLAGSPRSTTSSPPGPSSAPKQTNSTKKAQARQATPRVVEQVAGELPKGFPTRVFDAIAKGLQRSVKRL